MKYIKLFEGVIGKVLYECDDFKIEYNSNNIFCLTTKKSQCSAILYMADLIRKKLKYIDDPKLRSIEVGSIGWNLDNLKLSKQKLKNIKISRSGELRHFLDEQTIKNLPIDIFMELTIKYIPIIADSIENVKTLGDVIDNFTIIYDQLEKEQIELYIAANKYNL